MRKVGHGSGAAHDTKVRILCLSDRNSHSVTQVSFDAAAAPPSDNQKVHRTSRCMDEQRFCQHPQTECVLARASSDSVAE